jgi:beta-glucosidase
VHHLNLAHGRGVAALREVVRPDALVSVSLNVFALRGDGATGAEAVRRIDAIANRAFTMPMLTGQYPPDLIVDTASVTDWAFVRPDDLAVICQPIDRLGVNYYEPVLVRLADGSGNRTTVGGPTGSVPSPWPTAPDIEFVKQPGPYTSMGWSQDASGLEQLLVSLHRQFPHLPMMVTENGAAFDDQVVDGAVHDVERVTYLRDHVAAVHRAIRQGVDVRGYFAWSLLDNFEWAYGYAKRFGIVYVDYVSLDRIPKDSARWYAKLAALNRTPP